MAFSQAFNSVSFMLFKFTFNLIIDSLNALMVTFLYSFQLTELKDKIVTIEPFKEAILKFKLNHKVMTEKERKDWLKANVERIILDQDIIKMDIKKLLFRLE